MTTSFTTERTETPLPRPAGDPGIRAGAPTLHRLAALASLRDWVRRSSPVLMHEAVLANADPADVAAAARLTVAEAHLTWNTWASRRLAGDEELTLRDYLRVHTAFARVLNDSAATPREIVR